MRSVLFVCTGNICRSPTAEAIFRNLAGKEGMDVDVDSAGMHDFHAGEPPDSRSVEMALERGIPMDGLFARKIESDDFDRYDVLIAMDKGHEHNMRLMSHASQHEKIKLLLDYHEAYRGMDVPDPYYGGREGFERAFDLIEQGVTAFYERFY